VSHQGHNNPGKRRGEKRLPSQQEDLFVSPLIAQQNNGQKVPSACRGRPGKLAAYFLPSSHTPTRAWTCTGPVDMDSTEQCSQHPGRESSTRFVTENKMIGAISFP